MSLKPLLLAALVGAICFGSRGVSEAQTSPAKTAAKAPAKAATAAGGTGMAAPSLADYKPAKSVSGTIKSEGSDTMLNLMTLWTEGFSKMYPAVGKEVQGKGSATAVTALIQGTADFGPMSREMKQQEINDFDKKYGYKPTQLPVAVDMIAVFVHKDNPIESLSLKQLDAIFSTTRNRGEKKEVRTWGDLGLGGQWAERPISLYGRNAASGTYGYFKEHVLAKGDYKSTVKEQPGSSAVIQGIASDKYAIGYSGIGFKTADVKIVPLSDKGSPVAAETENALSGAYPLSRFLLLTVNHKPGSQLDPLKAEFIKYVLSKQGQQDVVREGFIPLPAKIAERSLKAVGM